MGPDCSDNFRHNPFMKDFRNLKVWEKAHQLALALYPLTASFPRGETYGLASQIRRAAVSIPSNIASASASPSGFFFASTTSTAFTPAFARNSCVLPHDVQPLR